MRAICLPDRESAMRVLNTLRFVASFALLGAVLTGVAVGWMDGTSFDPRVIGAGAGAAVAIIAKVAHVFL